MAVPIKSDFGHLDCFQAEQFIGDRSKNLAVALECRKSADNSLAALGSRHEFSELLVESRIYNTVVEAFNWAPAESLLSLDHRVVMAAAPNKAAHEGLKMEYRTRTS